MRRMKFIGLFLTSIATATIQAQGFAEFMLTEPAPMEASSTEPTRSVKQAQAQRSRSRNPKKPSRNVRPSKVNYIGNYYSMSQSLQIDPGLISRWHQTKPSAPRPSHPEDVQPQSRPTAKDNANGTRRANQSKRDNLPIWQRERR